MGSYDSFAALETVRRTDAKNAALSAAVDRATAADSELLRLVETSTWIRRDDLSLNPGFRVGARYEEISQLSIRPGHLAEWEELVKLVQDGYKKGIPEAHWGAYEEAYGSPGGRYLIIITLRSAAEIDANFASGKKFEEAMGEEGMKKMAKLEASCVESEQTNLFMIQPKMSYPPEATIQTEPGFWKVAPTAP